MRARAVIGCNFGDEGKGLVTDWLCAQGAGMVVRFNGGAQAGHTVVTPTGQRHVFRHFGSGSFLGVPTYLSSFFICNPIIALREGAELNDLGLTPLLYAHPNCKVTTFADMVINQRKEEARGDARHGSVGVGIHETMQRNEVPELSITMSDLWNCTPLEDRLKAICDRWAKYRTGSAIDKSDEMIARFVSEAQQFAAMVHPLGIDQCEDPVFEGAQGLLLDQNNKKFWPHVTHSQTGMQNVAQLCDQHGGITGVDAYYVTRSYLTRHGAGELPGERRDMRYDDDTNSNHPYQGKLRFAPLDGYDVLDRCHKDRDGAFKLVITHRDQRMVDPKLEHMAAALSYGPTRDDVRSSS